MENLLARGIATRRGVMASHLERVYVSRVGRISLPVTEEAARSTVLLPLYPTMSEEEQGYVVKALLEELGPS